MPSPARCALAVAVLAAGAARADGYVASDFDPRGSLLGASWEVAVPVGAWTGFVGETSLQGVQVEGRFKLARLRSVGLALSLNRFYQNFSYQVVQYPNATFSGPAYHRLDAVSLRATFHEYLTSSAIQPYLGIGLGGTWCESYQLVVDLSSFKNVFGVSVEPQVGVLITFAYGLAFDALIRYAYTTASVNGKDAQWLGLQVGLVVY